MAGRTGGEVARITDVAALAGVSIGTASKALNGAGKLRPETRERVRRAADQLGFSPDSRARALVQGRTYTVGMITTDSSGRFSIPIMGGAEDALSSGELALLVCDTRDDPVREQHYLRSLISRRVDGILVTGRRTDPRPPIVAPMPVVYAMNPSADPDDASVLLDNPGAGRLPVDHLRDCGRRRIAHVTGPRHHHSAAVRAETAAAAAGDAWAGDVAYGAWSEQWGRQAVDLLLARHPDLDAISAGSDQIARGVCDRLRELGRTVPGEVAVTGIDNWSVMAEANRPPLTTVDLRLDTVGRTAAGLLISAINGEPRPGPVTIPAELIIRASTLTT